MYAGMPKIIKTTLVQHVLANPAHLHQKCLRGVQRGTEIVGNVGYARLPITAEVLGVMGAGYLCTSCNDNVTCLISLLIAWRALGCRRRSV